jgi:uncharacterized membrane protein YfcA
VTVAALGAWQLLGLMAVGVAAGVFNGVAGGGTLLTFPALLAVGLPALSANITSTVGVVPSYLGSALGFRSELAEQRSRIRRLLPAVLLGAAGGALLLLSTPAGSFRSIVPWLVGGATLLFAVQPLLVRWLSGLHEDHPSRKVMLQLGSFIVAVYGGYFGAAMGVMMLALYGLALTEQLTRVNALRSMLSIVVSSLAALVFIVHGQVDWAAAGAIALGTALGGWAGATVARRLAPAVVRGVVVAIGTATTIVLLAR